MVMGRSASLPTCTSYVTTSHTSSGSMVTSNSSPVKVIFSLSVKFYIDLILAVEKNNDICKQIYFRHSNRWNAAVDIIKHSYKLDTLQHFKRTKRQYRYI